MPASSAVEGTNRRVDPLILVIQFRNDPIVDNNDPQDTISRWNEDAITYRSKVSYYGRLCPNCYLLEMTDRSNKDNSFDRASEKSWYKISCEEPKRTEIKTSCIVLQINCAVLGFC